MVSLSATSKIIPSLFTIFAFLCVACIHLNSERNTSLSPSFSFPPKASGVRILPLYDWENRCIHDNRCARQQRMLEGLSQPRCINVTQQLSQLLALSTTKECLCHFPNNFLALCRRCCQNKGSVTRTFTLTQQPPPNTPLAAIQFLTARWRYRIGAILNQSEPGNI